MNSGSNHIPREVVDEIREQSDIVEVISESGVPLKPAGKDYNARCPFHDEKTPSFSVSPQKQMFYCFGCQTGGNVISFVQKYEGKTFVETVEETAGTVTATIVPEESTFKKGFVEWRIVLVSESHTRLEVRAKQAPDFWIPPLIGPAILKRLFLQEVRDTVTNLERVVKATAPAHP